MYLHQVLRAAATLTLGTPGANPGLDAGSGPVSSESDLLFVKAGEKGSCWELCWDLAEAVFESATAEPGRLQAGAAGFLENPAVPLTLEYEVGPDLLLVRAGQIAHWSRCSV